MLNKVEIENYIKKFSNDFDKRFLKLIPRNNYFSKCDGFCRPKQNMDCHCLLLSEGPYYENAFGYF